MIADVGAAIIAMVADVGTTVIAMISHVRSASAGVPASLHPDVATTAPLPAPVDPHLVRTNALPVTRMPDPASTLAMPATLNEHEARARLGDPHLRLRRLLFHFDNDRSAGRRRRVHASTSTRTYNATRGAYERRYQCKASESLHTSFLLDVRDKSKHETIPKHRFSRSCRPFVKRRNRGFNATHGEYAIRRSMLASIHNR
jgi:hypothetical protein